MFRDARRERRGDDVHALPPPRLRAHTLSSPLYTPLEHNWRLGSCHKLCGALFVWLVCNVVPGAALRTWTSVPDQIWQRPKVREAFHPPPLTP